MVNRDVNFNKVVINNLNFLTNKKFNELFNNNNVLFQRLFYRKYALHKPMFFLSAPVISGLKNNQKKQIDRFV